MNPQLRPIPPLLSNGFECRSCLRVGFRLNSVSESKGENNRITCYPRRKSRKAKQPHNSPCTIEEISPKQAAKRGRSICAPEQNNVSVASKQNLLLVLGAGLLYWMLFDDISTLGSKTRRGKVCAAF